MVPRSGAQNTENFFGMPYFRNIYYFCNANENHMAYEKKIPVDLDCPLRLTMSLIESKWKSCILDELRSGESMRPSQIHRCLPEAAPRVLDLQLKEMVEDGLVAKTIFPELPPRSEYAITDLGKSLLPIIDMMLRWGQQHFDIFERKYGSPK